MASKICWFQLIWNTTEKTAAADDDVRLRLRLESPTGSQGGGDKPTANCHTKPYHTKPFNRCE